MIRLTNKKAGEKWLSFWLILNWIIIIAGIVIGVWILYSAKADVRAEEAEILAVRLADCIVDNGYLNEEISENNIFQKCNLDENIIDKSGDFYFNVLVSDFDSGKSIKEIEKGVADFKMQCSLKTKEEHLAECSGKTVYALNQSNDNQKFLIKITGASNQLGKRL